MPESSSSALAVAPQVAKTPSSAASPSRRPDKNFDLEEDNEEESWPAVDVGNLIIDLDADIDKQQASGATSMSSGSGKGAIGKSATMAALAGASGVTGSQTTTVTEPPGSNAASGNGGGSAISGSGSFNSSSSSGSNSSSSAAAEKGLKMKIKRTKTGTTRNPEGKLEIVQSAGGDAANMILNGVGPSPLLNAEDVVNAVTAAVAAKQGVKTAALNSSGKVKLTGGGSNSSGSIVPKVSKTNGKPDKQTNGGSSAATTNGGGSSVQQQQSFTPSPTTSLPGNSVTNGQQESYQNPPPAKKQKVEMVNALVGTEIPTMTEPDSLGPMDPGSSVTLEGIVWHETENGVLVINVTWRGKTYVGTLLDSTRHVNQWAPPRYSDSPTSELESRTPKGRSGKRGGGGGGGGGRGAAGTPVETETRKNLRSSKGKSRHQINFPSSSSSPSKDKRKGRCDGDDKSGSGSDSSDKKRPRTSSRNSPEEDEDSEREKEKENDSDKEKSGKDDESMTPKDTEEEKYVPPPPLPYSLTCPKPGCKKKYRQHNGLKFHVSFAHKELLNSLGEIRDMSEIERMEAEAKERLRRREEANVKAEESSNMEDSSNSGQSSKTSTPGPADAFPSNGDNGAPSNNYPSTIATTTASLLSEVAKLPVPLAALSQLKPNFTKLPGPPPDAKPIPVSAMEGVLSGSRPPLLGGPVNAVTTIMGSIPMSSAPLFKSSPVLPKGVIRPPSNARPIVPSTAPQLLASGAMGPSAINLKPIQPRPTIMADPTPNLALEELRRKKEPKRKKENSPGTSPPRVLNGSGSSPKANAKLENSSALDKTASDQHQAKSPAYSDISDDNDETERRILTERKVPDPRLPTASAYGPPPFTFPPYVLPQSSPQLPTVPVSSAAIKPSMASSPRDSPKLDSGRDKVGSGPQPGSVEYHKMLQAYGFPPFPYPCPPQLDPNLHVHLLATDPVYKAQHDRERSEKEKAFKDQIDRDNREKDRRAGVKVHGENEDGSKRNPEDLRKKNASTPTGMLSVKSEFRLDGLKSEHVKSEPSKQQPVDEGSKPTMETRGPPPGTNAYGYIHPSLLRPGFPGLPYDLGVSHLLLGSPYGHNPYLPPHLQSHGLRPPFGANDLLRSPFLNPASLPEDLSRSAAAAGLSTTKALDLLQQHANQYYNNHKIQELQERALKSPHMDKASPKPSGMSSPNPGRKNTPSPAGGPQASLSSLTSTTSSLSSANFSAGDRGRSPPPLRHVHTHTHTHFGLGYPLLPPAVPGMAPPAAHTPFSPAGFPSPLLPPKSIIPGFQPPK